MKNYRGYNMLFVMALLSLAVVIMVYIYMTHTVNVSATKSAAAREAVISAQSNKVREDAFMQAYQSTSESWARLPTFFIPSQNVVMFIEALENLGQQTGATTSLSSIDADNLDSASPGTIGNARGHVDVTGSWATVMRTLKLAEILPFKVSITAVHLDTDSSFDKNGRKNWHMTFDVSASMLVNIASSTKSNQ